MGGVQGFFTPDWFTHLLGDILRTKKALFDYFQNTDGEAVFIPHKD